MLTDYEIKRTETTIEKAIPYIEFILILIILQAILMLFSMAPSNDDAVRFRILANSNTAEDQQIKKDIQQVIQPLIEEAVASGRSAEEIEMNLVALEDSIAELSTSLSRGASISFERKDAFFPPKRSGFFIYPQSTVDAYILTIGSGRGDNWWCALFPKVCFPDKDKVEEEKVTFFVWEWIKGLFE
ncbi:stage II sporulation protein R [Sporosarcina sp. CAU 1771]